MKIGNTEYYVEQTTNTLANQTTQTINTRVYKSVNADLSVTIKPFVSGDDQITMEIAVSQIDHLKSFISEITFTEVEKIKENIKAKRKANKSIMK